MPATAISGAYFDYDNSKNRIVDIDATLAKPESWTDFSLSQKLGSERARLCSLAEKYERIGANLGEIEELLALTDAGDISSLGEMAAILVADGKCCEELKHAHLFSGRFDACHAFLSVQSGSGGLEAQDWGEMLMRMYLHWAERRSFRTEVVEYTPDEAAGIKSCTLLIEGDSCYGWLRSETGVHRLVRKSPFDSGNRRHTSFAAINVEPVVDNTVEIDINPADLRVDVFRASGAGGQHVNRTESAVRITHMPTNVVTQCQSSRSQHKNKATAMKQLKAKLYMIEEDKRRQQIAVQESEKSSITWGSQIRSYVLDQSRIKDLRTGVSVSDTQSVLDGNLEEFLVASLYHQAGKSTAQS